MSDQEQSNPLTIPQGAEIDALIVAYENDNTTNRYNYNRMMAAYKMRARWIARDAKLKLPTNPIDQQELERLRGELERIEISLQTADEELKALRALKVNQEKADLHSKDKAKIEKENKI